MEDLLQNIWNNSIIPVRPTFLARLDTMIGPVQYWKELSFIPLYHFYRFDKIKSLIYRLYREITLRPTFGPLYCPPLWWYAALCSYPISRMHISSKLMDFTWNYLCNQLLKVGKLKKGENSDQKVIGPLSQGRVRFKLLVQIVKGDVSQGHPGTQKYEMTKMGLKNRFTWKIDS